MFSGPFDEGVIKRARDQGLVEIHLHDIRDQAHDRHRTVDDYPFGGGPGMLMKPEPLFEAVEAVVAAAELAADTPVILLTPQGRRLTQGIVEELAAREGMVLICGRYEGVDERVREHLATDEISVGDYVLGGGELAAMVVIDAVSRLVPGVVGSAESVEADSFTTGLLDGPQYTRPSEYRGWPVPETLMSGDHGAIAQWRRREALRRTLQRRPDLLNTADLTGEDRVLLDEIQRDDGEV